MWDDSKIEDTTYRFDFGTHNKDGNNGCWDSSNGTDIQCESTGGKSTALTAFTIPTISGQNIQASPSGWNRGSGSDVTLGAEADSNNGGEEFYYEGATFGNLIINQGSITILSQAEPLNDYYQINSITFSGLPATLNLSPGVYAVNNISAGGARGTINIIGDGAVYLFVQNSSDWQVDIKGNADQFNLIVNNDIAIRSTLNGSVYSAGNITMNTDGQINGQVAAANLTMNGDGKIINSAVCSLVPSPPSADYYFEIETLSDALTCEPHGVQVSVKNSDDDTAVDDYEGTITLSSTPILGAWSLTAGNGQFNDNGVGRATYQFVNSDDGIAYFSLFNPVASSLTVTVSDEETSTTSDAIIFRPYQLKGELACVSALDGNCLTTANKPFQLTLTAVGKQKNSDSCEVIEEYTDDKTLKFWSSYLNPSLPVGLQVEVQSPGKEKVAIATNATDAIEQIVTFESGVATVEVNYPDAGQIQIHVRDDAGIGAPPSDPGENDELQGSATTVVNPLQLVISDIIGNKRNESTTIASTVANPATTSEGDGFIRASVPDYPNPTVDTFDMTVQAIKYCADATTSAHCSGSYGQKTPSFRHDVRANGSLFFPTSNSVISGTLHSEYGLTQTISSADQGEITYDDLAFDDVGTVGLSVLSSDYLGIHDNEISSEKDADGEYIVTQVGRFYPGYIAYGDHSFNEGCGDFTYMSAASSDTPSAGSAVTLNYVMQAKAQVSTGSAEKTTVNYDAGLGYPVAPSANFSHFAFSQQSLLDLSGRLLPMSYYDATQWQSGIYSVNALTVGVQKSVTGADGPYFSVMPTEVNNNDQLAYYIQLTGRDGEMLQSLAETSCNNGLCRLPADTDESSLGDFAYGRLQAGNGNGNELQSIRTLIEATYFNGQEFTPFPNDSCTPLLSAQLSANPSIDENNNIAVGNNGTTSITILDDWLTNGEGYLQFAAPNDRGTFTYYLRLKDSAANGLYSPWLLDSENVTTCPSEAGGLDECISGSVQFGLFRSNDRVIYRRQTTN